MKVTVFWTDLDENQRKAEILANQTEADKFIRKLKQDKNCAIIRKWQNGELESITN